MVTQQDVERMKGLGCYREAGQLQALLGLDCDYGCHYGMRSTRDVCREQFFQGYGEVSFYLTHGNI